MTRENKTLADLARDAENLYKAFSAMAATWERLSADDTEKSFVENYPFDKSFDEFPFLVGDWVEALREAAKADIYGKKLDKENKFLVSCGDVLRFSYGDAYIVLSVHEGGYKNSLSYTLQDVKTKRTIYSMPSSECYGATIEKAKEE